MSFELTRYVRKSGCASKIGPGELTDILCGIEVPADENVLAGMAGFEDAGVYRITDEIAMVQTIDFFTPVVNDPYSFGRIAAANALSDIYAMGAVPKTALNMVCFSLTHFDKAILKAILKGGAQTLKDAKVSLLGGHSVDDVETKYGLAATGLVHPDKIIMNEGAMPGDALILTKPLGNGIVNTGIKAGLVSEAATEKVIRAMAELNRKASLIMRSLRTHGATDVTGFGLAGHLKEMIKESLGVELHLHRLPFFEEARDLANAGILPGGLYKNRDFYQCHVEGNGPDFLTDLIYDPQTSGGLLIALHPEDLSAFRAAAFRENLFFRHIGMFLPGPKGKIVLP
ncbi:MAG TPA: selenide, water dikinase SelD [Syntrophorhabdaceae bacterium]|jgi:selenide,water dikinase